MDDSEQQCIKGMKRHGRTREAEVSIGARVRALRVAAGMSLAELGEIIGLTFQQVHKYEKGKDRISASTLQLVAAALGVHPGSFFESETLSPIGSISDVKVAMKCATGLQRVHNVNLRRKIAELIDELACGPEDRPFT